MVKNRTRNTPELKVSDEKLVGGPIIWITWSWAFEKSSMLFCKSRRLRKKSLDSSETALTSGGKALGGPRNGYGSVRRLLGGGGCREMNAGTIMKRRITASGRAARRYGSRPGLC